LYARALSLFCAGCALGDDSWAAEPVHVEIAGKVGAGTNPVGGGLPNPMGTGARVGTSMDGSLSDAFENRRPRKGSVGSNPSSSASKIEDIVGIAPNGACG
jgi:hypothetical protein